MKLPNAEDAYIDWRKIADYLLSTTHPIGKTKGQFFRRVGFTDETARDLEKGLLGIARHGKVAEVVETDYGTKYIVDGLLRTPTNQEVTIRTVWIIERGDDRPRFVTAHPRQRRV